MPTIRDVAKRANVAPITVSRVINNSGYVSQEVRHRVEQAIAELNYIPNSLGPSLRSKRTNILALVLSDITNPFWTTVARGVEDTANQSSYYVVLCNTDESQSKQDEYLTVMLKKRVDGILLVPAQSTAQSIRMIQQQGVPVVVMDRRVPDSAVDVVRCDSEEGAYHLTRHLLELGHQRIAIITGPEQVSTAVDRVMGFRRAMEEAGLGQEMQQVYWGEFNQKAGFDLTKRALRSTPRPTAIFAGNNFIAIGALKALREAGIQVPNDMAMVSFDDLPAPLVIDPFFTVAVQPAYEMGKTATELLLSRITQPVSGHVKEVLFPAQIIVRRSSQPDGYQSPLTAEKFDR